MFAVESQVAMDLLEWLEFAFCADEFFMSTLVRITGVEEVEASQGDQDVKTKLTVKQDLESDSIAFHPLPARFV